jgi:hypothetical protein
MPKAAHGESDSNGFEPEANSKLAIDNPMASQGPLDGRVGVTGSRAALNRKALERAVPSGTTYSWELQLLWRIRRSHGAYVDGT